MIIIYPRGVYVNRKTEKITNSIFSFCPLHTPVHHDHTVGADAISPMALRSIRTDNATDSAKSPFPAVAHRCKNTSSEICSSVRKYVDMVRKNGIAPFRKIPNTQALPFSFLPFFARRAKKGGVANAFDLAFATPLYAKRGGEVHLSQNKSSFPLPFRGGKKTAALSGR